MDSLTTTGGAIGCSLRPSPFELVAIAVLLLTFSTAATYQLHLPGLQYDECLAAAPAVNFVRATEVSEPMQVGPSVIHVFGRPLPVMTMTYIGPVKTLAHVPFLAALGTSPHSVRLMPVVAVALSLLVSWGICRSLWGRRVGLLVATLVALDPSWVFYLTLDVGPAALAVLLKLLAVAAGIGWWRHGPSPRGQLYLGAAALALGLGISHKVDFLWVVAALVVPLMAFAGRDTARRVTRRGAVLASICLLAGSAPIVVFNLATGARTFTPLLSKLVSGDGTGSSDSVVSALFLRLQQLAGLLSGTTVEQLFTASPVATDGVAWLRFLPPLAMAGAGAWLVVLCVKRRREDRIEASLLIHVAIVWMASCFSPTDLRAHHLLTLYPVPHVVLAVGLAKQLGSKAALTRRALASLVVAGVLIANLVSVVTIHRNLRLTGGIGYWSDAITDLADDLERLVLLDDHCVDHPRAPQRVRVMDWGFTNNLIVLSDGRLPLQPVYRQLWRQPPSLAVVLPAIAEDALYLFHSPEFTLYQELPELFEAAASLQALRPIVEASYVQGDGREVYRLLRLVHSDHSTSIVDPP